jgi:hypothetical protein
VQGVPHPAPGIPHCSAYTGLTPTLHQFYTSFTPTSCQVRGVPNPALGILHYSALIGVAAAFELSPDRRGLRLL